MQSGIRSVQTCIVRSAPYNQVELVRIVRLIVRTLGVQQGQG